MTDKMNTNKPDPFAKLREHNQRISEENANITKETKFLKGSTLYEIETIYKSGNKLKLRPISKRFTKDGFPTIFPPCDASEKKRVVTLTERNLRPTMWMSGDDTFYIYTKEDEEEDEKTQKDD